nr:SdrD B-like domain-containing protein [Ferruginibacter sp.]
PAKPIVTVTNSCGNSTLATSAAGSLLWSNGATTASITVTSAGTYTVNATVNGCTSANGTGKAAPKALPASPKASVTQPTCSVTTGTIKVTSSKTGLSFSINNSTYNTTGVFSNVTPGSYPLTAKNSCGCVSLPTTIVVSASLNCSSIGNLVFKDANGNGVQESTETGISGVTVKLLNTSGTVLSTTTTNSSGVYGFSNLAAGSYNVSFTTPSGYTASPANVGSDDTKDSDPVAGIVSGITLGVGQANATVDAGFIPSILAVGNQVWYDTNNDGINNSTEKGIVGITVKLYKDDDNNNIADGAAIATKTTDGTGKYSFTALAPGNYIIGAVIPAGYVSSSIHGGDPDNNVNGDDNGHVLSGNEVRGLAITLTAGTEPDGASSNTNTNNSYDFGMLPDCNCINTAGNLLTNGSFESGTTGWTASGGTVTNGTGYVACGTKNGFNTASRKTSLVYQDVTVTPGTTLTFSGFAGTHTPGLTCSPKLSLIFRSASGAVLSQSDVVVTRDVDVNFGQLSLYTITATAPAGTAKVRVQSSITCNYMKLDALCLRVAVAGRGDGNDLPAAQDIPFSKVDDIISGTTGFEVTANPNPVVSSFNLGIQTNDNSTPVNIRVHDANGKLIKTDKKGMANSIKMDAANWKSGLYFVEVIQGDQRRIIKLVKL